MSESMVSHPQPRDALPTSTTMSGSADPSSHPTGDETMSGNASECIDLRVGRVIAITPSQAIVLLERRDATGTRDLAVPLEMGTLVKLHSRVSTVYGMITGLRVPLPSLEPSEKDLRLVELELVGEIRAQTAQAFLDAECPRTRRWTSPFTSPPPSISRRFMRVPTPPQLGSGRSIRTVSYLPIFSRMNCWASISALSVRRGRENPALSPLS